MSAPNDAVWYILRDGERAGPFTNDEFTKIEDAGHLRPKDQVWQTGMDSWVAYSDINALKAERLAHPDPAASSANALRALGTGLAAAFRSTSTRLGRLRASAATPATDASPEPTAEEAAGGAARQSADAHPASIRPSLVGAKESNVRRLPITPVLERLRGEAIEHNSEQDRDSVRPDVMIEVAEPSRPSASTPRLVSESQAAADIGLELATFRTWVADGRLPRALPDCGKYDMRAIHLALDRLSGIASGDSGSNGLLGRPPRRKT